MSTREYHRHDDGSVVLGEALRCIDPDAGAVDVIILDDPAQVGVLAAGKAEALRSQAEFFQSIDMPIAADHCYEAAFAYEAPGPFTRELNVTLRSHHIVSANSAICLNCGKNAETTDPCMPAKTYSMPVSHDPR